MRRDFFGSGHLQPGDGRDALDQLMDEQGLDIGGELIAEINTNSDEDYGFGGELRDPVSGEGIGFDGFETLEEAKKWLVEEIGVPPQDIETVEY